MYNLMSKDLVSTKMSNISLTFLKNFEKFLIGGMTFKMVEKSETFKVLSTKAYKMSKKEKSKEDEKHNFKFSDVTSDIEKKLKESVLDPSDFDSIFQVGTVTAQVIQFEITGCNFTLKQMNIKSPAGTGSSLITD